MLSTNEHDDTNFIERICFTAVIHRQNGFILVQ